ncbi:NAD(P)/FAD-dependent oxidoreductase [Paenarthrobacter sp. NPDC091711]|uniref:NAD(P)/FAD-dependent oxidoreductase n=1 Tax=Paenarthrobacter sp. NPDC091711 TaxID=3364385 RepID=UPI00382DB447
MHLVVVGASLAGLKTVEAAHRKGIAKRITLVGAEPHVPYNRPPLSKEFLASDQGIDSLAFQPEAHFDSLGVELKLGNPAEKLDLARREITVGGEQIGFDALVIATGTRTRALPSSLPGHDLGNVFYLRSIDDAAGLRASLNSAQRVVVIGGGFIGAEVACAAKKKGAAVTVVEAAPVPLVRAVGEDMGAYCAGLHGQNGVELHTSAAVVALKGTDSVEAVVLADGRELAADVVVVGIGAVPNIEWLADSGLDVSNGVLADEFLNVGHEGVYAVGDVVRWPNPLFPGTMRLESWTSVVEQAERAIGHLADPSNQLACAVVPYFWSDQYGARIQCLGVPTAEPPVVAHGSQDTGRFLALYRRGDTFSGVFAFNSPHLIMKFRPLIQRGASWEEALSFCASLPDSAPVVAV